MFDNIGKKIKEFAKLITVLGFIGSAIAFFVFLGYRETLTAFIILIAGGLISWIGSFSLYAYGELVDNTKKILENTIINNSEKKHIPEEDENLSNKDESEKNENGNLNIKSIPKETLSSSSTYKVDVEVLEQAFINESDNNKLHTEALSYLELGDFTNSIVYYNTILKNNPTDAHALIGRVAASLELRSELELPQSTKSFAETSDFQKALEFADDDYKSVLNGYLEKNNSNIEIYTEVKKFYDSINTGEELSDSFESIAEQCRKLSKKLESIKSFKDSDKMNKELLDYANEFDIKAKLESKRNTTIAIVLVIVLALFILLFLFLNR